LREVLIVCVVCVFARRVAVCEKIRTLLHHCLLSMVTTTPAEEKEKEDKGY
jgi:hypothetical protein